MPIEDAEYVQYAFEYRAPNRGLHGQGTVGQELTSVTHHVFYVKKSVDDNITDADTASVDTTLVKLLGDFATVKNVAIGAATVANTETGAEDDARILVDVK